MKRYRYEFVFGTMAKMRSLPDSAKLGNNEIAMYAFEIGSKECKLMASADTVESLGPAVTQVVNEIANASVQEKEEPVVLEQLPDSPSRKQWVAFLNEIVWNNPPKTVFDLCDKLLKTKNGVSGEPDNALTTTCIEQIGNIKTK